jgi:hypothetical protein
MNLERRAKDMEGEAWNAKLLKNDLAAHRFESNALELWFECETRWKTVHILDFPRQFGILCFGGFHHLFVDRTLLVSKRSIQLGIAKAEYQLALTCLTHGQFERAMVHLHDSFSRRTLHRSSDEETLRNLIRQGKALPILPLFLNDVFISAHLNNNQAMVCLEKGLIEVAKILLNEANGAIDTILNDETFSRLKGLDLKLLRRYIPASKEQREEIALRQSGIGYYVSLVCRWVWQCKDELRDVNDFLDDLGASDFDILPGATEGERRMAVAERVRLTLREKLAVTMNTLDLHVKKGYQDSLESSLSETRLSLDVLRPFLEQLDGSWWEKEGVVQTLASVARAEQVLIESGKNTETLHHSTYNG